MSNEATNTNTDLSSGKTIKAAKPAKGKAAKPAKGKAAKPAKAVKPAKAGAIDYAERYTKLYAPVNDNGGEAKITVLAAENPKRKGSESAARFAKYKTGMTYAQAIEKGLTRADISWDLKHGYIKLGK